MDGIGKDVESDQINHANLLWTVDFSATPLNTEAHDSNAR